MESCQISLAPEILCRLRRARSSPGIPIVVLPVSNETLEAESAFPEPSNAVSISLGRPHAWNNRGLRL